MRAEQFKNGSRNIPNIGKNVPDTICGLGDIRNNFNIFLISNNIRNNICVPDIMRNHFKNVPNMAVPILIL